jgi:hypothetical protein
MLFMGIDNWDGGQRDEVFKRLLEKGTMVPAGVKIIGQWAEISGCRNFTLFESDDPKALAEWWLAWSDLIKGEAVIVMEIEEATKLLK